MQRRWRATRTAWWLRECAAVGDRPRLHGRPTVKSYVGTMRLGHDFALASVPVASHLVVGNYALLEIGDNVSIGHGAAIAAFEKIVIGDGTRIAPFVIVMDTNFHSGSGDQSVQHDTRPVVIGRNCRIGSRVTITRGVTIGDGTEVLAGSLVSSSLPAGVCAGGVRARVLGSVGAPQTRAGWDSAAALVPILLMEAIGSSTPPELGAAMSEMPGWDLRPARRLAAAVQAQFGLAVDAETLVALRHVSEIAAVVENARGRRALGNA